MLKASCASIPLSYQWWRRCTFEESRSVAVELVLHAHEMGPIGETTLARQLPVWQRDKNFLPGGWVSCRVMLFDSAGDLVALFIVVSLLLQVLDRGAEEKF